MTAWLPSVRLATTANLDDDGGGPPSPLTPGTLDGVAVLAGNEILVKDQLDATQNGTWVAGAFALDPMMRRADTFDPESTVRVSEGDRNTHTSWTLRAPASAITVGADPLPWLRQDVSTYAIDTIADLRGLTQVLDKATATVAGYHAASDGGGGQFRYESAPPASAVITGTASQSAAITAVSNGTPIVVTSAGHPFVTDQAVLISGTGTVADNKTGWIVTRISASTFSLNGSIGGTQTGIAGAAESTIVTTSAAHALVPAQQVMVGTVSSTANDTSTLNAVWPLFGTLSTTTFSIPVSATGAATAGAIGDGGRQYPAGAGRWLRTLENALNPRMFGCRWDGLSDDLTAFKAMLATLPSPSGSVLNSIDLPSGTGYFSDKLSINKLVKLAGRANGTSDGTVLVFAPGGFRGLAFENVGGTICDGSELRERHPVEDPSAWAPGP